MSLLYLSAICSLASGILFSGLQRFGDFLGSSFLRMRGNLLFGIVFWLALLLLIVRLVSTTAFFVVFVHRFFNSWVFRVLNGTL